MIAPAIALFIFTCLAPLIVTGRLSFYASDYQTKEFVGLKNFELALTDYYFQKSFLNALIFTVFYVPAMIVTGYKFAVMLVAFSNKTQAGFRLVLYLPGLAAGLIISLLWRWMLQHDGLINQLLSLVDIAPILWLAYPWPARAALAMMLMSVSVGGTVIYFTAALCRIPPEVHDAAVVDGASWGQYKRYVLLPLMMPMILLLLLIGIVGAMSVWEFVYVLYKGGGPEGSVATPVYEIFRTAFNLGQQGRAAAKGLIFLVVVASMIALKQRVEKWVKV